MAHDRRTVDGRARPGRAPEPACKHSADQQNIYELLFMIWREKPCCGRQRCLGDKVTDYTRFPPPSLRHMFAHVLFTPRKLSSDRFCRRGWRTWTVEGTPRRAGSKLCEKRSSLAKAPPRARTCAPPWPHFISQPNTYTIQDLDSVRNCVLVDESGSQARTAAGAAAHCAIASPRAKSCAPPVDVAIG